LSVKQNLCTITSVGVAGDTSQTANIAKKTMTTEPISKRPVLTYLSVDGFVKSQYWWFRKKSENTISRHSGEGRNPVISNGSSWSGLRFPPEWRLFAESSNLRV